MRRRRVRSYLNLPEIRFGVTDRDWRWVIAVGLAAYFVPFILDLKFGRIPVPTVAAAVAFVGSVAFANWARMGRPPGWLGHTLKGFFLARELAVRPPGRCVGLSPTVVEEVASGQRPVASKRRSGTKGKRTWIQR